MSKKLFSLFFVSVAILATVGVTSALAYQGDFSTYGPNHTEQRELTMGSVIESNDYERWLDLMTKDGMEPGVVKKIDSQEKFDRFAEAYKLAQDGKIVEANAIRSELGLGNGNRGLHRGNNFVDANGNGVCDLRE